MVSKLKIEGLEKLVANNEAVANELARQSRKVIIDEADKMVSGMKSRAPRRTGALEMAIKKRIWKDKHGITGAVVGIEADHPEFKVGRGGKYYYPASQEYGWTVGRVHYPGQPYMRPTFEERRLVIRNRLRNTMKSVVDRVRP